MNLIVIDGRLTKQPELKMTTANVNVLKFTIASRRDNEHSDFVDCVAFDASAEFIAKHFKKGDGIIVTGEIRQNSYTSSEGKTIYNYEVYTKNVDFPIQKKKDENTAEPEEKKKDAWESAKDIEIPEEELPFY